VADPHEMELRFLNWEDPLSMAYLDNFVSLHLNK
jgi:hypothetical protein